MRNPPSAFVTELLDPGVPTCAGCAMSIAFRMLLSEIGPHSILVIPPGCGNTFIGLGAETTLRVPAFMGNLGATAAFLSGIGAGMDMLGRTGVNVIGFAGDGATVDIGLQSLSGALERGHRFLYICYDNEGYMNTGAQGSGSTPLGSWTTTTPGGKATVRKDIARIVLAHGAHYVATASIAFPEQFRASIRRGLATEGSAFIHLHIPCTTGWRFRADRTVEVARLAVETGLFPLFEVTHGRWKWIEPRAALKPVTDYFAVQRRFDSLTIEQIARIQQETENAVRELQSQSVEGIPSVS